MVTSCNTQTNASTASHLDNYPIKTLKLGDKKVKVYIANNDERQRQGLSKIQSKDFPIDAGMLFPDEYMHIRQFWMPETYFDLDVIFMNSDYYVLDIHRGLKHFPGKGSRREVPLSKEVFCQHVLELRADSPLAKLVQPGMTLKFE